MFLIAILFLVTVAVFLVFLFLKNRRIKTIRAFYAQMAEKNEKLELTLKTAKMSPWTLDVLNRTLEFDFSNFDVSDKNPQYKSDLTRYYYAIHPDDVTRIQTSYYEVLNNTSSSFIEEYRVIMPSEKEYRWVATFAAVSKRDSDGSPLFLTGASVLVDKWHE